MELTQVISTGRQVIEGYGASGFRVTGIVYARSILVFPDATLDWPVAALADVTLEVLQPVLRRGGIEILLLGCGARMAPVPPALRQALRSAGIGIESMDTGAACRTYNLLMAENRRVAAALLRPG
jgi:uncharacterized protein